MIDEARQIEAQKAFRGILPQNESVPGLGGAAGLNGTDLKGRPPFFYLIAWD
jgi:hypothetical protein